MIEIKQINNTKTAKLTSAQNKRLVVLKVLKHK